MSDVVGAIIVAAGSGTRMAGADKLFTEVGGRPLLAYAIAAFEDCPAITRIILVLSEANLERGQELAGRSGFAKVASIVHGGMRRQDSVRCGLEALGECDYVAVHDGARPLVTPELIELGIAAARETGAAVPALPVADTVKEAGSDRIVVRTLDRNRLWAVQTPQVFRYELLLHAHRQVTAAVTDDAAMVEALGERVRLFDGDPRNVKVTTVEDLEFANFLLVDGPARRDGPATLIYHIASREHWTRAEADGWYRGDTLDSEGFIHCSAAHQVVPVANSVFRGRQDLVLLSIDPLRLSSELRWEASEDRERFPHVYGAINQSAVAAIFEFKSADDGLFKMPVGAVPAVPG
jgi:2-C-methyl-D-erythritol 4-phosphate cytidylyltransferase